MLKYIRTLMVLTLASSVVMLTAYAQDEPKREITQIRDNLYRFQNNYHYSVFLVTDEGVIVTDPINAEAATWLKDQIKERFDQPIKYVIYSHHHADHVSGGEVFADDDVVIIAHENAMNALKVDRVPTAIPTRTFVDKMEIELGGETVELYYLGKNHSDNSIAVLFPEEKTLFAVDFVSVQRLPYKTLSRSYFPDFFEAFDRLAEIDFEILAPGHGKLGTKQDALDHGIYLNELYFAVQTGVENGKTLEQLQKEITLDNYADWDNFDQWRTQNIEGMYGYLTQ